MRNRLVLVIGYVLSLGLATFLGFTWGKVAYLKAEKASRQAQVEFLLSVAYPTNRKSLLPRVPPVSVMSEVSQHRDDPELVRSILVSALEKWNDEFQKSVEPGSVALQFLDENANDYWERSRTLASWKLGDTSPREWTKPTAAMPWSPSNPQKGK